MNEEERYLFDLWGYLVVEDVLSKAELGVLNEFNQRSDKCGTE